MTAAGHARRRRRRRNGRANGGGRRRNRVLAIVGGLVVLLTVIGGSVAAAGVVFGTNRYNEFVADIVPAEELIAELPRGGAKIYDRNGDLMYEFVDSLSGLRRPVDLDDISHWMIDATVATEDASFWTNDGLNYRGLARAAWENFSPFGGTAFEGSGGSSITQQLAKNVYIPREERSERTVERKLKEAALARELTQLYSKQQILQWYLNSISYGGIYVGVDAAAQGYFDKSAADLTLAEAALLAGIPQSPSLYDPYSSDNFNVFGAVATGGFAKARQREVLNLMVRTEYITQQQADEADAQPLVLRTGRFNIQAPHFVLGRVRRDLEALVGERAIFEDGLEVWTTIDLTLQHEAEEILEQRIAAVEDEVDGHNGALYALDPHSGEILVYVGSRDYFRDDIEGRNDNIIALNAPGSSLKPFTYMTAFMQGWGTTTGIIDMPFAIIDAATGEPYSPRNFNTRACPIASDCKFQGVVPADQALGNSLNTPALKTILFAGVQNTLQMLKTAGFTTFDNPLGYGPALTLGGADVTLEDLTYAYSVLAGEGVMRGQETLVPNDPGERTLEPVALLRVIDADGIELYNFDEPVERRVVPSNFVYLATSIISSGDNQCITWTCGALELSDGRPSAKKTGTSEPFEDTRDIGDTWAVGYTPELVAGVWAGNADNSPMVNILSTTISWRAWRDFMDFALDYLQLPPTEFERPEGVVEREVCWPSGRLPSELCPRINRHTALFAADVLEGDPEELAALQDDWWQVVPIDSRTGLLATTETPSAFVSNEIRLVLPRDEILVPLNANELDDPDAERKVWAGLAEWAAINGLTGLLAPLEESSDLAAAAFVRFTSPREAETVDERLTIRGRASSPAFERYVVEWRRGNDSDRWVRIKTSSNTVGNGELARWDTSTVPNGEYTLRVVVTDGERGELTVAVPIVVDNGDEGATEDLAPVAVIIAPLSGDLLAGTIDIAGVAVSGDLALVVVELGLGLAPTAWTEIARGTEPVTGGTLAEWDTTEFEDGTYTLRLRVRDKTLGSTEVTVLVTVQNAP